MANPVHPKAIGGLAGTTAGGGLGFIVYGILERVHVFAALDATTKLYIAGVIVTGLSAAGQFVVAYLSKWEPTAAAEAGSVIHVLDPTETKTAVADAVNEKWMQMQAAASQFLSDKTLPGQPDPVLTDTTPTVPVDDSVLAN